MIRWRREVRVRGSFRPGRRKMKDSQAMSQPKNLKKLTRARMERTGESYTTARKAILTNRPEPVSAQNAAKRTAQSQSAKAQAASAVELPEELPEYPAPDNVQQYDAALWHRVLTQAGVTHPLTGEPLSEALLFGLGGGIGFMLHSFSEAQTFSLALTTRAHPEPFSANLVERSGTKVRIRTTGNAQAAAANLDAGLDAGRAIVVRVSRAALPWINPAEVDPADTIDVAVLGEMDDALLIDAGTDQLELISPEDLAAARAKHKRDKNYCAWVPSRRAPKPDLLRVSVLASLEQATGRMLGSSELPGLPAHYARNFGVAGMRQFAERLSDTTGETGWPRLLASDTLRHEALRQLDQFLSERRFAATDGFRGLFAAFLNEAAQLPELSPLAAHTATYQQLTERWMSFTGGLRQSLTGELDIDALANLGTEVHALADAESSAATALSDTVEKLAGH